MKRTLVWFLVVISLMALLLRFSDKGAEIFLGVKETSGISILSTPSDATVFLNNAQVGKTPYEDKNLAVGDYVVGVEKDEAKWEGKVSLAAGTVTVVDRDIATDSASSAGENLSLEKGKGLTVISNPAGSDIEIDGQSFGKTPLNIDIKSGEHTILVSHPNYLKRSIRATLPENYNLVVAVDLALSEADLGSIATPVITQTQEVVVKQTPTGFLRVRDKPSLNGKEIAQVKPGDSLVLLEVAGEWERVRLADGTEGYVSSAYVEKKNPQ